MRFVERGRCGAGLVAFVLTCSACASARPATAVMGASTVAPPSTVQASPTSAPAKRVQSPATVEDVVQTCTSAAQPSDPAPPAVTAALTGAATHPGFDDLDVSVSIWIDGWGEVLALNPGLALAPASNQKLLVAIAANALFEPEDRLRTTIEQVGADLVVRPGGDPTLTTADIDALATQVRQAGVEAAQRLVVDLSAYPQSPRADGWLDWQIPTHVGPLSGLMIDDNRWTQEDDFVADPAPANGAFLAERLELVGVEVGDVVIEAAAPGALVGEHESPTIGELLRTMLQSSDNQHGDLLMMELGRVTSGVGSLEAGSEAIDTVLRQLCVPIECASDDGSGLSRGNERSAREFQQILRALDETAHSHLFAQLPVAGLSGTMSSRFVDDADRVQAKTGTIIGGRALSGFATTDSDRDIVFSIIVNGEPEAATASLAAIDQLVTAALRS